MLRAIAALVFALVAAIAEAAAAPPAFAWWRAQGWSAPAPCSPGAWGALWCALAAGIALAALFLALCTARRSAWRRPLSFGLLTLAAVAGALRAGAADDAAPRPPAPSLAEALRGAARGELPSGPLGLCLRGRALRAHLRGLAAGAGPQLTALPGDPPGTLYRVPSADGRGAFFTIVGQRGVLRERSGAPLVAIEGAPAGAGFATPYPRASLLPR